MVDGKNFNVHVTKLDKITNKSRATVPDEITDITVIKATGDILYQKFRKNGVISESYETALNLLDTTKDGYEFLLLLLQQAHTNLLVKSSATIDMPRFTTYKCIFKYAKAKCNLYHV